MYRKRNKYHNTKTRYNDMSFDSVKEKRRYQQLLDLRNAGEISDLRAQVKFVLIPAQRDPVTGKLLERECSYYADFVYVQDGKTVVEDVKGYRQGQAYNLFVIKRKLMLFRFGIQIKEV